MIKLWKTLKAQKKPLIVMANKDDNVVKSAQEYSQCKNSTDIHNERV